MKSILLIKTSAGAFWTLATCRLAEQR